MTPYRIHLNTNCYPISEVQTPLLRRFRSTVEAHGTNRDQDGVYTPLVVLGGPEADPDRDILRLKVESYLAGFMDARAQQPIKEGRDVILNNRDDGAPHGNRYARILTMSERSDELMWVRFWDLKHQRWGRPEEVMKEICLRTATNDDRLRFKPDHSKI